VTNVATYSSQQIQWPRACALKFAIFVVQRCCCKEILMLLPFSLKLRLLCKWLIFIELLPVRPGARNVNFALWHFLDSNSVNTKLQLKIAAKYVRTANVTTVHYGAILCHASKLTWTYQLPPISHTRPSRLSLLATVHCAYPRRDDKAELTWWLVTYLPRMVYPQSLVQAQTLVIQSPLKFGENCEIPWMYCKSLLHYYYCW